MNYTEGLKYGDDQGYFIIFTMKKVKREKFVRIWSNLVVLLLYLNQFSYVKRTKLL